MSQTVNATLGQQYEIMAGVGIAENYVATFDGVTTGAVGALRLFQVSGVVALKVYAQSLQTPASQAGGTLALGTATNTTGLITTTTASNISINKSWIASPAALAADTVTNFPVAVTNEDIILTVGTSPVTTGVITFTAIWRPLSPGASLKAYPSASSASASASPSASLSPSSSTSPSSSQSPSASRSPSSSTSPSISPSASLSPSSSASSSISPSSSSSPSSSTSPSASASPSSSQSPSASRSPSASASDSFPIP